MKTNTRINRIAAVAVMITFVSPLVPSSAATLSDSVGSFKIAADLSRRSSQELAVKQAANIIAVASATLDPDGDGFPEAPPFVTGAGPSGGGLVPTGFGAPVSDGYGGRLGYCAWDNGSVVTGGVNRLAGSTTNVAAPAFAVVSAGLDGVFNRTCAQIAAGTAITDDDFVVAVSTVQIKQGVGGTVYYGDPVATIAALNALNTATTRDGELRLVRADNTLWRWNSTSGTWVTAGSNASLSSLTAASAANLIDNAANAQRWNWQLGGNSTGFAISETAASTGGSGGQYLHTIGTLAGSSAIALSVAVRGVEAFRVDSTNPQIVANAGTVAAPSYAFNGAQGTGLYLPTATSLGAAIGGVGALKIDPVLYQTAVGYGALPGATGINNIAFGHSALAAATTGNQNIAIGNFALQSLTTGAANTAIGNFALQQNTGNANTAVGNGALALNTVGINNTGLGSQALGLNTTGNSNMAIGISAAYNNVSGSQNIAIGDSAFYGNTTGTGNTVIGTNALNLNTTGFFNVAIGANYNGVPVNAMTGYSNTFIGTNALTADTAAMANSGRITLIGADSSATGLGIGAANAYMTAIGSGAVVSTINTVVLGRPFDKVVIGSTGDDGSGAALQVTGGVNMNGNLGVTGSASIGGNAAIGGNIGVFIGKGILYDTVTDSNYGTYLALPGATRSIAGGTAATGLDGRTSYGLRMRALDSNNTNFIWENSSEQALMSLTADTGDLYVKGRFIASTGSATAPSVTFVGNTGAGFYSPASAQLAASVAGVRSLYITSGSVGLGQNALLLETASSSNNTAVGNSALKKNDSGGNNTAIGFDTLSFNQSGDFNTAVGKSALRLNTTTGNTAIGDAALSGTTTGGQNVAVGRRAGYATSTNVNTNANVSGTNNTFLGAYAMPGTATQLTYATALGSEALVTTPNTIVLGRAGGTPDVTVIGATGDDGSGNRLQVTGGIKGTGNLTIGGTGTFANTLTLAAGTTAIAPLKLQTGVNLTTPAFGAVEFDGTNLYLTNNSGTPTRKTIAFTDSALTGNAATATKLATARTITATGDAAWSVSFDGSADVTSALTLAPSGVTAGTYGSGTQLGQFTVDAKGRITSAANVNVTPDWVNITNIPAQVSALGSLGTSGLITRTAAGTLAARTLTAGSTRVSVVNGDGVAGNPTIDVAEANLSLNNLGGTLSAAKGGTGLNGSTAANGQILIGNSAGFTLANITGGTGLTVTNGAGTIALANTGVTSFNTRTGAVVQTLADVNGVVSFNSGNLTLGTGSMPNTVPGTSRNTAVGQSVMPNNTAGGDNAGLGYQALNANVSGSYNTAIGSKALLTSTSDRNTAVGALALTVTTGTQNTGVGNEFLQKLTTGSSNTAVGFDAGITGSNSITSDSSTFIGKSATIADTAQMAGSGRITLIGADSSASGLGSATLNAYMTAIGSNASVTTVGTVVLGRAADVTVIGTTGDDGSGNKLQVTGGIKGTGNLTVGGQILAANGTLAAPGISFTNEPGTGLYRTAAGELLAGLTGTRSMLLTTTQTGFGYGAMAGTPGAANTGIGVQALGGASSGANNTAIGFQSLQANGTGANNSALGKGALKANTTGGSNVGMGVDALLNNNTGSDNVAIGKEAVSRNAVSGNSSGQNVGVGTQALYIATGSTNTGLGYFAGRTSTNNLSGTNSTFVGANATVADTAAMAASGYITAIGANATASGLASLNATAYMTAIGAGSSVTTINTVVLGRSNDKTVIGAAADDGTAYNLQVTGGIKALTGGLSVAGGDLVLGSTNTTGTLAARPTFGVANRVYITNDTNAIYRDTGSAWVLIGSGSAGTPALSSLTAATAANSINNGAFGQTWNWQLTAAATTAFNITENAASTGGGAGTQFLMKVGTLASSTAIPLSVSAVGVETFRVNSTGNVMIGSSTDDATNKLQVTGAIKATGNVTAATVITNNGTAAAPSHTFATNTSTGFYLPASGQLAASLSGTRSLWVTTNMVALGSGALAADTTLAHQNVAIGTDTLSINTGGTSNTAVGYGVLQSNVSGSYSTGVGNNVLVLSTVGGNTAVGESALQYTTPGTGMVALGNNAGGTNLGRNTTGSNNTFIGSNASIVQTATQLSYATVLGSDALVGSSNTIVLGRASNDMVVIGATTASGTTNRLQVTGNTALTGNFAVTGTSNFTGAAAVSGATAVGALEVNGNTPVLSQGAFLQWNKVGGLGKTFLMTQKGSGSGGISFGEVTTSNVYTENMFLSATGALTSIGNMNAPAFVVTSDARLKENIQALDRSDVLQRLKALNGYRYNLIADPNKKAVYGVLAQEMLGLFPDLVKTRDNGYYGVDYGSLGALAAAGVGQLAKDMEQFGTGIDRKQAANGMLMIGNGNGFTLNTLTADTGISITNSAGRITIKNTGVTGFNGRTGTVTLNLEDINNVASFGNGNVTLGTGALAATSTGTFNTASGQGALGTTDTGSGNTAQGYQALFGNTSGANNTGVGRQAGYANRAGNSTNANLSGSNNTFIGANALPGTAQQLNYATAIGSDAVVTTSGTIVLGRTDDVTVLGAAGDDRSGNRLQVTGGIKATGTLSANALALNSGNRKALWIDNDAATGAGNALVQAGDSTLVFTKGAIDSAAGLVIGPWSAAGNGVRIATSGVTVGGPLTINGSINSSTGYAMVSDARFKKNIDPIKDAIVLITKLNGVRYEFDRSRFPGRNFDAGPQLGLIAQQVEPILPELVRTDAEGYKSLQYSQLAPLLIEGIKAQQAILKHLVKKDPTTLTVDIKTFQGNDAVFENIKSTNIKTANLEAETARIKKLEADSIESKSVRSDVVKSGEAEIFVSVGTFQPIFSPQANSQYIVNVTAEDGSSAFASVAFMSGKISITPISGKGVDVTSIGAQVGLVAASKKVKATWIRMS